MQQNREPVPHHPYNPFTEPSRRALFNSMANREGHTNGLESYLRATYPGNQAIPGYNGSREPPNELWQPQPGEGQFGLQGNPRFNDQPQPPRGGKLGLGGNPRLQEGEDTYEGFLRGLRARREVEDESLRVRRENRIRQRDLDNEYFGRLEGGYAGGDQQFQYGQQPYYGQPQGYGGYVQQPQYGQAQDNPEYYQQNPHSQTTGYGGANQQPQFGQMQNNPGYYQQPQYTQTQTNPEYYQQPQYSQNQNPQGMGGGRGGNLTDRYDRIVGQIAANQERVESIQENLDRLMGGMGREEFPDRGNGGQNYPPQDGRYGGPYGGGRGW